MIIPPNIRSGRGDFDPGFGFLRRRTCRGWGTDPRLKWSARRCSTGTSSRVLNERRLAGVRFVPVRFTPRASVFQGEECGGVNLFITDRAQFRPVQTGLEIAVALRRFYPAEWQVDKYARLLVNADTLERLKRGETADAIALTWQTRLEEFRRARSKILIYR